MLVPRIQQSSYKCMHLSEKAMAPHSSTPAWKIPWMEEPGGLQSMGLLRVGHDWVASLSLFTFMHWRPVFLPGEFNGHRSQAGYSPWVAKESKQLKDTFPNMI